jgi:hypothetical protein
MNSDRIYHFAGIIFLNTCRYSDRGFTPEVKSAGRQDLPDGAKDLRSTGQNASGKRYSFLFKNDNLSGQSIRIFRRVRIQIPGRKTRPGQRNRRTYAVYLLRNKYTGSR